jgi:subtilisin family serine protease
MKLSITAQVERFAFYIIVVLALAACYSLEAQQEKLDPWLVEAMNRTDQALQVVVTLAPVEPVASGFWGETPNPAEVEYHLKKRSVEIQWQLRQQVDQWAKGNEGIKQIKYFWAANAMMATASQQLIMEMAALPEVNQILLDRKVSLNVPYQGEADAQQEYTYGLQKIGVQELREKDSEMTGKGVLVGILDTGIDANHPDLQGKVVAWKDFIDNKDKPYDDNKHGTHVAGTIAGGNASGTQIGVAPEVKLVIGKILSGRGGGKLSGILRAMEWIANPDNSPTATFRPRVGKQFLGWPNGR